VEGDTATETQGLVEGAEMNDLEPKRSASPVKIGESRKKAHLEDDSVVFSLDDEEDVETGPGQRSKTGEQSVLQIRHSDSVDSLERAVNEQVQNHSGMMISIRSRSLEEDEAEDEEEGTSGSAGTILG
jgi:hypothetical protein